MVAELSSLIRALAPPPVRQPFLRVIADALQRDPGEPREAEDAATGGREIDNPTARIRAPIGDRDNNTAPISSRYTGSARVS